MPDRREMIVTGLMLCYAMGREEAEHLLRMHEAEQARETRDLILEKEEPNVFHLPLKWWRLGRNAAVITVCRDVLEAHMADEGFDEKGHKR